MRSLTERRIHLGLILRDFGQQAFSVFLGHTDDICNVLWMIERETGGRCGIYVVFALD